MVTGKFYRVTKEFNPNQQSVASTLDTDGDGIVSTQELNDKEMKIQQKVWVNRINKFYNMILGLLGGMGLMHLILMIGQKDKEEFMITYATFSNLLCAMTQFFANVTLILGLTLTLIYKQKSDDKMRNMDPNRLEFRQQYQVSLVTTILVTIAWIGVNIMPKYTNSFYYLKTVDDSLYSTFKLLAYVSDAFFLISWIVASVNNNAAINVMDLEPDDDGEDDHVHMGDDGKVEECEDSDGEDLNG